MEQVESYEISLLIKELRLSVKFPCRLTLQHSSRPISPEIQSNNSSVFSINRQVSIKEEKNKDYLEINVNLATDKGGNIMAGIIKINLKDIGSSEGQSLTVSLQKCLDPYATCLLVVKSVKTNRSRVKKGTLGGDWKLKSSNDQKFESRSEAPIMDIRNIKQRSKYNEGDSFGPKKPNLNTLASPMNSQLKEKALSMVGFRAVSTSFDRDEFASRFKHLGKRENEDNKTVMTGKWKQSQQAIKASLESNEKTLKLEILKYKTKFEESERNMEEKGKQIKGLKDQITEMNRQLTEKQYLVEELATKNNHIARLQQTNKSLSKQIYDERNKLIDIEKELQQEKNNSYVQMSRYKQENDKKEHDLQKSIYERKEEIKEIMEQNHYKANQISKMKNLIEDLESNLQTKTYEYEKMYSNERNEHSKTKTLLQQKISDLMAQIKKHEETNHDISSLLKKVEEENLKLQKKMGYLEDALAQSQSKLEEESKLKEQLAEQKKRLLKSEEELNYRLRSIQKEQANKEKEFENISVQLSELSLSSKKKITEMIEKNKSFATKIQQLQNKVNVMTAQEEKLKRNLQMAQKEAKILQENEKITAKNAKIKDDRILQLEKELTEIENKNSMKENLAKKEAEYKAIQLEKLSVRVEELEKSYEKEKETSEGRRVQLLKSENKIRMIEQANNRLSDQVKELKANQIKKDDDWLEKMKEVKEELKLCEARQAESNKDIHNSEIEKINLKNEISKLQKTVENLTEKYERKNKREIQLEATIKTLNVEIQDKCQDIAQIEASFKALENEYKFLQADKTKTEKISNIINEEKVVAVGDINKLKKQIERREQKEEQYLNEIKELKEQTVKLDLKWNTVVKQFEKFKTTVSESIKNSVSLKTSYNAFEASGAGLDFSRMNRSRMRGADLSMTMDTNELKFGEAIQNLARQSQQTIMMLAEEGRKLKKEKQLLEKDVQALTIRLRQSQEDSQKKISELTYEIQTMSSQNGVEIEEYEDKIFNYQKELKKREKNISELIADIEELKVLQSNEITAHEISVSELVAKINSLKSKIADQEMKDESHSIMFVNLEEKIASYETESTVLIHQTELLTEHLAKKEKQCYQKLEEIEDLTHELENVKKLKSDLLGQLMSVKESLAVERQNTNHLNLEIKDEEAKNTQLRVFNAQLLKQKQLLIKKEAELSERINVLEEKVQMCSIELAEKSEDLSKKDVTAVESREEIKALRMEISNNRSEIADLKLQLEREKEKIKERERRIIEKDDQLKNVSTQAEKTISKLEGQVARLTEENDALSQALKKEQNEGATKCHDYELEIRKLKDSEKKLNEANIALQEQLFFQKQMGSLSSSKVDQLNQEITNGNIENDRLNNIINSLNDQLREKEESLYAMSGKLFTAENKIESKEDELRSRLEKVEMDWRYKLQEICQEYQNKIEIMQREKNYVKSGMEGCSQAVLKLQSEKTSISKEMERERQSWQARLKKAEEEKLVSLIQKNRQIEKIREVFQQLEEKLKKKDFEIKSIEDDKKKTEDKIKELRSQNQKSDQKKNETIRNLEREIDQMKRKEGQLKRFKQALKNNQWATERQIKKNVQSCAKTVIGLASEQSKEQVMAVMRNLQASIAKMALPNIDEM